MTSRLCTIGAGRCKGGFPGNVETPWIRPCFSALVIPRSAHARVRVTVVGLCVCVCVSVCLSVCLAGWLSVCPDEISFYIHLHQPVLVPTRYIIMTNARFSTYGFC